MSIDHFRKPGRKYSLFKCILIRDLIFFSFGYNLLTRFLVQSQIRKITCTCVYDVAKFQPEWFIIYCTLSAVCNLEKIIWQALLSWSSLDRGICLIISYILYWYFLPVLRVNRTHVWWMQKIDLSIITKLTRRGVHYFINIFFVARLFFHFFAGADFNGDE